MKDASVCSAVVYYSTRAGLSKLLIGNEDIPKLTLMFKDAEQRPKNSSVLDCLRSALGPGPQVMSAMWVRKCLYV